MQPYSMHSTVVLVAMESASLQPAPATISRCMGSLFLMIWMYSLTLIFSVFFAADAKVLGLILLPDADDSQQGEQDGDDDAHRSQRAEEPGGSVAALIVLGKDGGKELHGTHAQQAAHRVEDGKQGRCLGSLVSTVWPERVQLVWKV